jgi:hypothetical protein
MHRLSLAFTLVLFASSALAQVSQEAGFESLFDGQTLKGWHASAQTGHSRKSGNKSGGRWVVENGAIVGSQDIPGNGGIFLTDEQFGNYEVVLEMNNDFGPDSGLFLRCDEKGTCYQAMIDYHVGGNLMGLYGEGRLGAKPHVRNFTFLDRPGVLPDAPGRLAEVLETRSVERVTRPDRGQPAAYHHVDQGREVHGLDRDREASSRQGRHWAASSWRRRFHQAVRPLPQHPHQATRRLEVNRVLIE